MKTQVRFLDVINVRPRELAWTVGLIGASIVFPGLFAHTPNNQWITGTLVNACLFLAAWRIPMGNAFFVALFPSSVALMRGLLPPSMATLIPYIIFSNILLLFIAAALKKRPLLAVLVGSMGKGLILVMVSLFLYHMISSPYVPMLQFPQFITAIAGGMSALLIQRSLLRFKK